MNKKYLVVGSFLTLAIVFMGTSVVSAYNQERGEKFNNNLTEEQKQERQEKRAEMKVEMEEKRAEMNEIMEVGDYNAWELLHEEREANRFNILDVITEDNFDRLVEMHNLRQADDMEGAKVIAEELGLEKMGNGHAMRGKGMGRGMHRGGGDCNQNE